MIKFKFIKESKSQFLKKVVKTKKCWNWIGATRGGNNPYGNVIFHRKKILAHRVSWMIFKGKIPKDKFVLHKCDKPLCVRPSHLFYGTLLDNNRDRRDKNRSAIGNKHGSKTHPEIIKRGEDSPMHKLTEVKVRKIRSLYKSGMSSYKIAPLFNASPCNIWSVATYKTWKHIK